MRRIPGYMFLLMCVFVWNSGVAARDKESPHWSYEGVTGPDHWGQYFPQCGTGKSQSPIDIHGPFKTIHAPIHISYKQSNLRILNNGHTVQINYDPGSTLNVHGAEYELLQFHFHKPSEEKITGKAKAMVIHFVHKNKAGKLAVIGALVNEGKANEAIQTLWANLPAEEGKENVVKNVTINASALLPSNLAYYHYIGSLTTPPCTEGVDFYILETPIEMSKEQIAAFPFQKNARPVQPLNGRQLEESSSK